ncbi:hypothetical protein HB364_14130 [Pseudoflavitalea sp. X16]|uniref:hypothetical protein n=1 Tax=Paraflavitalea devenefica TaxID=2716334 RepID=UPI00141DD508|nr:hypothetical protein [Paraflavitalea devenefica]NII26228.1 hypothetical protein [Paraflavitalea devenefica]
MLPIEEIVAEFYPVVAGNVQTNEKGYERWKELVTNKIKGLMEQKFPYGKLVERLAALDGIRNFVGEDAEQFPGYSISFELDSRYEDSFSRVRTLWINISMLTDIVTFFVEDQLYSKEIAKAMGEKAIPPARYLYNHAAAEGSMVILLGKVKEILQEELPIHEIIPHILFFEKRFSTELYHNPVKAYPTAFDLLFSYRYASSYDLVYATM